MDRINEDPVTGLDIGVIKQKYGHLFDELRDILNVFDPICMIGLGAPVDEYDPEVATIILSIHSVNSEAATLELIYREFTRWFSSAAGEKRRYESLAKEIYEWRVLDFKEPIPFWILN
ncbi:MAG TPA: hypothetical protein PKI34_01120 [Bacteroidales bacterium]|nr:hypothetical protein [Bacteroidales bacterium]